MGKDVTRVVKVVLKFLSEGSQRAAKEASTVQNSLINGEETLNFFFGKTIKLVKKLGAVYLVYKAAVMAVEAAKWALKRAIEAVTWAATKLWQTVKKAVEMYVDFETVAARATAVMKTNLQATILASKQTLGIGVSMKEAATGMEEFSRAGFNANETFASFPDIAMFASAAGTNLKQATSLTTAAMRAFALTTDDTKRIVTGFTNAIVYSRNDFDSLATAFGYAASAGSAFGQTFEGTLAAIMSFRNLGLQASTSGTVLRRTLSNLAKPSRLGAAALERLGITAKEVTASTTNSFADIVRRLSAAGATTEDMMDIVGKRYGAYMSSLVKATQDGNLSLDAFENKLKNSTDTLPLYFQSTILTFSGQLQIAKNNIDTIMISLGQAFEPLGTKIVFIFNQATKALMEFFGIIEDSDQAFKEKVNKMAEAFDEEKFRDIGKNFFASIKSEYKAASETVREGLDLVFGEGAIKDFAVGTAQIMSFIAKIALVVVDMGLSFMAVAAVIKKVIDYISNIIYMFLRTLISGGFNFVDMIINAFMGNESGRNRAKAELTKVFSDIIPTLKGENLDEGFFNIENIRSLSSQIRKAYTFDVGKSFETNIEKIHTNLIAGLDKVGTVIDKTEQGFKDMVSEYDKSVSKSIANKETQQALKKLDQLRSELKGDKNNDKFVFDTIGDQLDTFNMKTQTLSTFSRESSRTIESLTNELTDFNLTLRSTNDLMFDKPGSGGYLGGTEGLEKVETNMDKLMKAAYERTTKTKDRGAFKWIQSLASLDDKSIDKAFDEGMAKLDAKFKAIQKEADDKMKASYDRISTFTDRGSAKWIQSLSGLDDLTVDAALENGIAKLDAKLKEIHDAEDQRMREAYERTKNVTDRGAFKWIQSLVGLDDLTLDAAFDEGMAKLDEKMQAIYDEEGGLRVMDRMQQYVADFDPGEILWTQSLIDSFKVAEDGMSKMIKSMIMGGESIKKIFRDMGKEILSTWIDTWVQIQIQHLMTSMFQKQTERNKNTSIQAGHIASIYSGTFALLSSIFPPPIPNAMASAQAAMAKGTVAGLNAMGLMEGTGLSGIQGGIIGRDSVPAMLAPGEIVLNNSASDVVRAMASNGTFGGDTYNITIQALDSESFEEAMPRLLPTITKSLRSDADARRDIQDTLRGKDLS